MYLIKYLPTYLPTYPIQNLNLFKQLANRSKGCENERTAIQKSPFKFIFSLHCFSGLRYKTVLKSLSVMLYFSCASFFILFIAFAILLWTDSFLSSIKVNIQAINDHKRKELAHGKQPSWEEDAFGCENRRLYHVSSGSNRSTSEN